MMFGFDYFIVAEFDTVFSTASRTNFQVVFILPILQYYN